MSHFTCSIKQRAGWDAGCRSQEGDSNFGSVPKGFSLSSWTWQKLLVTSPHSLGCRLLSVLHQYSPSDTHLALPWPDSCILIATGMHRVKTLQFVHPCSNRLPEILERERSYISTSLHPPTLHLSICWGQVIKCAMCPRLLHDRLWSK